MIQLWIEIRVASEREIVRGGRNEDTEELSWSLLSQTLLSPLVSLVTRTWLLSAEEHARRLLRFSYCCAGDGWIVIIMAHSIPSVLIPPKAFVKSWNLLSLSTSGQERTKLFNPSSLAKPVNSNLFCEIHLQLSEEIAAFLSKNQPSQKVVCSQTEKYPCVALECWKCFGIISRQ